jgi:ABC-type transporter Mla MlaB component
MRLYQHDSVADFRFEPRGELEGAGVQDLEQAWEAAKSTLAGKELIVDLAGVTGADEAGFALLSRMRESGALLMATLPRESPEFLRTMGIPAVARDRAGVAGRMWLRLGFGRL